MWIARGVSPPSWKTEPNESEELDDELQIYRHRIGGRRFVSLQQ